MAATRNMDMKKCPMPSQAPDVRNRNFDEVALGYTYEMAVNEARRCLSCPKKPCVSACPVQIDIPAFIACVANEDMEGAYQVLSASSALPAVCGRVCPQENQCEGKCVRGIKGESVAIGRLERFVADWHREHSKETPAVPQKNGHKVAIVGAGPSGLTAAGDLAKLGYSVTVYEALHLAGGVLVYGIPEFRLPRTLLDDFEYHHLILKDIKIRPNTTIGGAITIEDLLSDGYKSVFVGTGMWQPNTLHIPGETLGNVHFGVNYLCNPDSYHLGETINVIGAGNAAMNVCRTALRKGVRNVNCFVPNGKITAPRHEYEYAKLEGVKFWFNKKPIEITDEGVVFDDIVEYADGTYENVPGSRKLYKADSTIISVSQGPRSRLVGTVSGLQGNRRGLIAVDEYGRTSRDGVFACSDTAASASSVVQAVAQAKTVAHAMDAYMQGRKIGGLRWMKD